MTRQGIAAIVSALFLAGAGAAAAPQGTSAGQSENPKEMAVTGCVIQGSAPEILLLDDARFNPQNKDEKARTYVLVSGVPDLPLRTYLNKEVRVTGEVQLKPAPTPGQKTTERDLPKLSARSIAAVADRCTVPAL
jgi:hypothetical protein